MDPFEAALVDVSEETIKRLAINVAATRSDSWENDITGFGTSRDKTTYTCFGGYTILQPQQAANLYHGDDLAARMVDIVPDEMLREGFEVDLGDPTENAELADQLEALSVRRKFANGIRWGRLYGGGALLIGADDGRSAAAPLLPERARSVQYLYELDRRYLWPFTWYTESGHPKLGQAETYLVSPTGVVTSGQMIIVHESRLIMFGGATTGLVERQTNNGWDHSVLQRIFDALRGFNTGLKAVEILLTDGSQAVMKLRGLAGLLGANGEETARKRLMMIDLSRSVLRAVAIDAGSKDVPPEEFIRQSVAFGSIPDVLDRFMLRLAAAVQIPVTILMGQSPAGMNATGDADFRWFYSRIRAQQTLELAPRIRRLVNVMRSTKALASSRSKEQTVKVKFPALWSEAPSVEATRRLALANADVAYVNANVLTPQEVALSRFGQGNGYGEDIVLTDESIAAREGMVMDAITNPRAMTPDTGSDAHPADDTSDAAGRQSVAKRTDAADLIDIFKTASRVVIAGGPRTGKSTLAVRAGERNQVPVRHADSLVGVKQWSDASDEVARWLDEPTPWIVEGVSTPRAIRKWLAANPDKKLDATVIYLRDPIQVRSKGQVAMAKGVHTVWREIRPELAARGVQIVERDQ